jgi:hypothetical protein
MPYANIHWIKLKLELLNDKRFIFDCNNDQKWMYIGLLLLAGGTGNKIPNDENYIKNRLNLPESAPKIRENLDFLIATFPKLTDKNGCFKFKNFNALHNRLGNSEGNPEELQRGVQIREDKSRLEQIRKDYNKIKGYAFSDLTKVQFGRDYKAIKVLLKLAGGNDSLVSDCFVWASKQKWCDWTMETCIKKWNDFMLTRYKVIKPSQQDLDKEYERKQKEAQDEYDKRNTVNTINISRPSNTEGMEEILQKRDNGI